MGTAPESKGMQGGEVASHKEKGHEEGWVTHPEGYTENCQQHMEKGRGEEGLGTAHEERMPNGKEKQLWRWARPCYRKQKALWGSAR